MELNEDASSLLQLPYLPPKYFWILFLRGQTSPDLILVATHYLPIHHLGNHLSTYLAHFEYGGAGRHIISATFKADGFLIG